MQPISQKAESETESYWESSALDTARQPLFRIMLSALIQAGRSHVGIEHTCKVTLDVSGDKQTNKNTKCVKKDAFIPNLRSIYTVHTIQF